MKRLTPFFLIAALVFALAATNVVTAQEKQTLEQRVEELEKTLATMNEEIAKSFHHVHEEDIDQLFKRTEDLNRRLKSVETLKAQVQ